MLSLPKAVFLSLTLFILCFAGLVSAADLFHQGFFSINGTKYCQPVRALQYTNISAPGAYQAIVAINDDGSCSSALKRYSDPLPALDEEVSFVRITTAHNL
jgi:hypothetical protein